MTANKMPVLPEAAGWKEGGSYTTAQMRDYGRACYLAGLEAAKACVPGRAIGSSERTDSASRDAWNACRETTLTNLTALEQEAKK